MSNQCNGILQSYTHIARAQNRPIIILSSSPGIWPFVLIIVSDSTSFFESEQDASNYIIYLRISRCGAEGLKILRWYIQDNLQLPF